MSSLTHLSSYYYDLPEDLVAKEPLPDRDASRLLVVDRKKENFSEIAFRELSDFLNPEDRLIFNNSKVIPARLFGTRDTGGKVELLLIKPLSHGQWLAWARPGKKLRQGAAVHIGDNFQAVVHKTLSTGEKIICFLYEGEFDEHLERYGRMPLPPYMKREDSKEDRDRYQTVYAKTPGSVAAPTAGLHFSRPLLDRLKHKGVFCSYITLHVGAGTFQPVGKEDIRQHKMHSETFMIDEQTAEELNRKTSSRKICIGTTTCRALESVCDERYGLVQPGCYETNIFIYPGYSFRYVSSLLTNFHLPESSLLMLVCAFGGYELIMEAYRKAAKDRFRFFSYGDAMLII